jgi:HSP20 family molecular chaperone IbpA
MSLFVSPHFYTHVQQPSLGSFGGLQRLFDDFDRQVQQSSQGRRRHIPKFTPKFDLKETETSYELHGELAGIEKDNVHIEFSDPQTIVVRGHINHSYTAGSPPAGLVSNNKEAEPSEKAATGSEAGEEPVVINHEAEETSSNKSYQATVEDEAEEGSTVAQPTPATTIAETAKPAEQPKPQTPKHKYWVSERSYGQFSRSFTFPGRVETEGVSASLNNGILIVTVPKAKKHESRRITIN